MKTIKLKSMTDMSASNFTGLATYPNGTKRWFLNGELHNEHGPATIYPDETKYWYLNGKRHREDGPAVVYPNGKKHWYLNGKEVDFQAFELYYMLVYKKIYDEKNE